MAETKTITGWLVVDWKKGNHRTRKSKPSAGDLGKNELLAKISIEVHVPDVPTAELAVAIDVPEPQVRQAALEALSPDQLPDWTDEVPEVVSMYEDELEGDQPYGDVINSMAFQVLSRVESRPDPETVRRYIHDFYQGEDHG